MTRRGFLRVGSLSALGLTLPGLLRADSGTARLRSETSCILIWLQGGLSHIDSFDPKPDAPPEVRGEFSTIATRVPGIFVSEQLPKLAAQQDRFSILRSLDPMNGSHGVADSYMLSGHPYDSALTFPSYGSVVAREKGNRDGMPAYVQVGQSIDRRFGGGTSGFLGDQYNPFVLRGDPSSTSFQVRDVSLTSHVDRDQSARGTRASRMVDTWRSQSESAESPPEAADSLSQDGLSLITSPRAESTIDLRQEAPHIRDRYGRSSLGQGCLLARRLVDSGVRFVTVTDGGWDTHRNNFKSLRSSLLPRLDSAVSALLQDLHDRGQLDSTLVMVLSDFGRAPRVNALAGRDHCSTASVALLAGGGLKGGIVVGRTDAHAERPFDAPYTTEDLAATLYDRLGIPLDTTHNAPDGRPVQINSGGRLIRELL